MSRWNTTGRVALIALMGASALALSGCGKRGVLETPPPLFGDRARERYEAQKEQQAQDAADSRARKSTSTAVADQPDNAPLTTRDIKAPEP
jgi:predicted small lipoprotein YifL